MALTISMSDEDAIASRLSFLKEGYCPKESVWVFFFHEKMNDCPKQGFKLHVSATIMNSREIFDMVIPFLIKEQIPFKVLKSNECLLQINANVYGYSQVGKFITVYPRNDKEAVVLAEKLHVMTSEFSAIQIPSDFPYRKGSNVHYRYGVIKSSIISEVENVDYLETPTGELQEDLRLPNQPIPKWVKNPFQRDLPQKSSLLFDRFLVIKNLRQRAKGGVYQVLDFGKAKAIPKMRILKEARNFGEMGLSGVDAVSRLHWEEKILRKLDGLNVAPKVFDLLQVEQVSFCALRT